MIKCLLGDCLSNYIDLTGKRFGRWLVIERDYSVKKKNIYWKCKCDCGTVRSVAGTSLRSGISVSCGCEKNEKTSKRTIENVDDMVGKRFGHWVVLERDYSNESNSRRGARWICQCDCGKIKSVLGYSLRAGRTTSCGCVNAKNKTVDLTGQQFGELTVISLDKKRNNEKGARWICQCNCGNTISVLASRLKSGQTRSCGCLKRKETKRERIDLTGRTIGSWEVLRIDKDRIGQGRYYICQCKCGTIKSVSGSSLKNGLSKSCGCSKKKTENDLTGQRFGKLTVLGIDTDKPARGFYWKCLCDCGNIKSYQSSHLKNGKVISCGCESRKKASERQFKDITGQRFGRLIVLGIDGKKYDNHGNSEYYWKCRCDCGNEIIVRGTVLRRKDTKSCGCLQAEESMLRAKERTIDLTGKRFGLLTVLERVENTEFDNNLGTWKCKCDCGNEKYADGYYLRKGMISSCGCLKQSKYELYVLQYFDEIGFINSIDYECQKRFDDLRGYSDGKLSFDFAVYKNEKLLCLIECQGQQHYKPVEYFGGEEQFEKQQIHDNKKREYAKSINAELIEIPYTVESYNDVKNILRKTIN